MTACKCVSCGKKYRIGLGWIDEKFCKDCFFKEHDAKTNEIKSNQQTIVKTYKGNQEQATEAFQQDIPIMEAQGYFPISQTWSPGSRGCGAFLFALILCFLIIGILVFIYMIIVKPAGTLSVTYELRKLSGSSKESKPSDEKTCPKCAENIKAAAIVCRFCGHNFE